MIDKLQVPEFAGRSCQKRYPNLLPDAVNCCHFRSPQNVCPEHRFRVPALGLSGVPSYGRTKGTLQYSPLFRLLPGPTFGGSWGACRVTSLVMYMCALSSNRWTWSAPVNHSKSCRSRWFAQALLSMILMTCGDLGLRRAVIIGAAHAGMALARTDKELSYNGEYHYHYSALGETIALIPKAIGNRKRDCAWGWARRINTTSENQQIEKHKSGRHSFLSQDWFVLFRSADFLRWCLSSERNLTHQSFFLFSIVFGIDLIHFFDEKKVGAAGNSIVCFGASIPCHAINLTEGKRRTRTVSKSATFLATESLISTLFKRGEPKVQILARKNAKLFANTKVEIFWQGKVKIHRQFQRFGKGRCKIHRQVQRY